MSMKSTLSATAVACATALGLLLPGAPASASGTGVHAGAASASQARRVAPPVRTLGIMAPSAFGCNDNTCIEIDGSGTSVTAIFGETTNPFKHSVKTTGTVYDNGTAIHSFPTVTLMVGGMTSQEWASPNHTFHDGDQVCVRYSGITGDPCETIG